jgi:hypothetical protein
MATNSAQFPALFRPALHAIVSEQPTYPDQYTEIFKTESSSLNFEQDVEMRMAGLAGIKAEGAPVMTDTMIGQRIITNYIPKTVGLNEILTKEAIQDNQYPKQFPLLATSLRTSLRTTKNILLTNIINNGFNTNAPIGDGQPVFSASHPIDGGVYSNIGPNAGFSETAIENGIVQIQKMKLQSGIRANVMARKTIVPPELQFAAARLYQSSFRTGVANNDISAIYNNSYMPEGYRVNQYLVSASAYIVLTDALQGFQHFQRDPVSTSMYVDFQTNNVMMKAEERYSGGITNPRAAWGSRGA